MLLRERDPFGRDARVGGDFVVRRRPVELGRQPVGALVDERVRVAHVRRHADGARRVGERAPDRLADPPRGIRRELEALLVVELVDRPHQAEVALLDEVEQGQPVAVVALGDRDDEAQVALDEPLAGRFPVRSAGPHDRTELALFGRGQERMGADLLEITPKQLPVVTTGPQRHHGRR